MAVTRASVRAGSAPPDDIMSTTSSTTTPRNRKRMTTPLRRRNKSSTPSSSSSSSSSSSRSGGSRRGTWSHTPTLPTLLWLSISLPLVAWDTGYVLLRPLTMEGGSLHYPLYAPYKLYGTIDHVYGWKAWEARNGFTAAQGFLNLIETLMYLVYLTIYVARRRTVTVAAGSSSSSKKKKDGSRKRSLIEGKAGGLAVLIAFSAAVMTFSKTVLYWANEYFSGFDNIGHNSLEDLVVLWIIPNGAWLVGSAYMICSFGSNILDGLAATSAHA